MSKLKITKKPFSETKYYNGTYRTDVSLWEDEYQEESYDFTVAVNHDNDNQSYEITEITWVDEIPRDVDSAEEKINSEFFDLID
jgi:hypothetical protein